MSRPTPTLMNLPPPSSGSATPSEIPGTPNSTMTSMSELSTVAIKDGHRGHPAHNNRTHPDMERADRISRLAGLERAGPSALSTPKHNPLYAPPANHNLTPSAAAPPSQIMHSGGGSYFDALGRPVSTDDERRTSTTGSASATTASAPGTTSTAPASHSSEDFDESEGHAQDTTPRTRRTRDAQADNGSVISGYSDEGTSNLVAFGEGAATPAAR